MTLRDSQVGRALARRNRRVHACGAAAPTVPSRLSRSSHPDCRATMGLTYVVGIQPSTKVARAGKALDTEQSVEALAMTLDRRSFRHVTWRHGTNTPLHSWFGRIRVRTTGDEKTRKTPRAEQWLLIEWEPGLLEPTKYFLATLPASCTLERLVSVAKMRWRIERDYQMLKQEVGLNQFEGRSWTGFHHHATLCIATYSFLTLERLRHPGREKNVRRPKQPSLPEDYIPRGSPANAETR